MVLKEISVPLWDQTTCASALRSQFGPSYQLPDTAVCAGAEGRDACDVRRGGEKEKRGREGEKGEKGNNEGVEEWDRKEQSKKERKSSVCLG